MYLNNHKRLIEFLGHRSKVKVTGLNFSILSHCELLADANVIALNIAACHGGYCGQP